ncbi:MAG TPA: PucR family transcriptional regulator [Pseudolysinimonas sp.]|nr:PucR family transcriptional regulator [Pseudolysinimonas sp.]
MVTLVQLVAAVSPALVPVTDAARGSVEITGIHISELRDPTPYLEGGEVLLTTGMAFTDPGWDARDYVDRLRERGVHALAIGVGPQIDEIPAALVELCRDAGLPLLMVPADQLFIRVTRGYWDLVAASGRASLVTQLGTQTALVREAAKPDGIAGVVSLVAQAVGGWAAYIPLQGADPVMWPANQSGVLPRLQEEVRRFAERGNVGAATFPLHGYDVVAHPVGSGAQVRGALTVGVGRRPSSADRQLILTATAVLGLRERAQGDAVSVNRAIGEAVVNLLLAGEVTAAQALVETTGGRALPATVRVLAFPVQDDARGQQAPTARVEAMIGELVRRGLLSAAAAERSRPARVTTVSGVGVLLLSGPQAADGAAEAPAAAAAHAGATPLRGALSEVVRLGELPGAVTVAIRRARDAAEGELVSTRPLGGLDEGELAAERLATYTRAPLVETTRSYLRHRGSWEAAARELGVHRNTIRNRMRIVEHELGIDLEDPDLSAELWIALRTRP